MKWFKFPHEITRNTKFRRMPVRHRYAFIILLCIANRSESPGSICDLDDEDLAFEIEMSIDEWLRLKLDLTLKGLISASAKSLEIVGWENYEAPQSCSDRPYRKHQESVFFRDEFRCVYCGSRENLSLDHKTPQSRGGDHSLENLVTCCIPCNSSKGAKTPEEWGGRSQ
jgi:hypothetical protein